MRPSRQVTIIASVALILCLASSVLVLRRLDSMRSGATLKEVLLISSPKVLKRLSLGYDGLLADVYWTRTVQYFGGKHYDGGHSYALLAPLLEITTALDPQLIVAYEFGANFLAPKPPNGAGLTEQAIKLTNFGIQNNPQEWHLYYDLGFVYYMDLKDYRRAAEAFAKGAEIPGAHPFLRVLAAQMAQHGGELEMARLLWFTTYQSTGERSVRANAAAHLRALQVDEDVINFERAIEAYHDKMGSLPANLDELKTAGLIKNVPLDPLGNAYKLTADGRVEVVDPDDLPFITKGTPIGYVPPPPRFLPTDH